MKLFSPGPWFVGSFLITDSMSKLVNSLFCFSIASRISFRILWLPDVRPDSLEKTWCWERLKAKEEGVAVKRESAIAQPYPTPSDPMDCSSPDSSIHGIFQARVLEWGAIAFSDIFASLYETKNDLGPSIKVNFGAFSFIFKKFIWINIISGSNSHVYRYICCSMCYRLNCISPKFRYCKS